MHRKLAKTPPLGWNSWDCFGAAVNEKQLRENADYMAKYLKPYGWGDVVGGNTLFVIFSGMSRWRKATIIIILPSLIWMNSAD